MSPLKRFFASVWETTEVVIIALITVFIIRTFIAQPFLVSGASMQDTFQSGNYLLVDELTYRIRPAARGEVIVFHYPRNEQEYFIKRIIGLPGETLTIANNTITITTVDGQNLTLDEPYVAHASRTFGEQTFTLEDHQYFVMGDNRGDSFDSRNWGPLDADKIVGIARLRLFPFSEAGIITPASY